MSNDDDKPDRKQPDRSAPSSRITFSGHYLKRRAEDPIGHGCEEKDAEFMLDNHEQAGTQASDRRDWYWGNIAGKAVLMVMTATATATGIYYVRQIVHTMHRRKKPRQK